MTYFILFLDLIFSSFSGHFHRKDENCCDVSRIYNFLVLLVVYLPLIFASVNFIRKTTREIAT